MVANSPYDLGRLPLPGLHLDSQVAGNNGPVYPKVDHYWCKVAHDYELLALQAVPSRSFGGKGGFEVCA